MKSKWLNVRMTPDEWAAGKKKADESGVVMSDLVRAWVRAQMGVGAVKENKKGYRKKNKKEYWKVAEQIARVGNNINQLTRWANTQKSEVEGARMIKLFSAALAELKRISAMVMGE